MFPRSVRRLPPLQVSAIGVVLSKLLPKGWENLTGPLLLLDPLCPACLDLAAKKNDCVDNDDTRNTLCEAHQGLLETTDVLGHPEVLQNLFV